MPREESYNVHNLNNSIVALKLSLKKMLRSPFPKLVYLVLSSCVAGLLAILVGKDAVVGLIAGTSLILLSTVFQK